jgi:hypothetical protein
VSDYQVFTIDDRYGHASGTALASLTSREAKELWDKVGEQALGKNLLSSVHCPVTHYPWRDINLKYVAIKPGPKTIDITNAMRVIKSNAVNLLNERSGDTFEKLPLDDDEVANFITSSSTPKETVELITTRGYATRWELYEFPTTYSHFPLNTPILPDPSVWVNSKVLINHVDSFIKSKFIINLDLLYDHDIDELAKLFGYFDVTDFDETVCWEYFDKNIELYDTINATGDWKEYISGYINIRLR